MQFCVILLRSKVWQGYLHTHTNKYPPAQRTLQRQIAEDGREAGTEEINHQASYEVYLRFDHHLTQSGLVLASFRVNGVSNICASPRVLHIQEARR